MRNSILNTPQESTLDLELKNELNIKDINEVESNEIEDMENNNVEQSINNTVEDTADTKTDCLALVVRDSYHMQVVKNIFRKTVRLSFKIALSTFTLNFLNMFL